MIDQAIKNYETALQQDAENEKLLLKYTKSIDFKYTNLPNNFSNDEKIQAYFEDMHFIKKCKKKINKLDL